MKISAVADSRSAARALSSLPLDMESCRIDYLDAIRGLAALSVVASHFVHVYGLPTCWLSTFPLGCWWDGQAAVSLFFVLSGFVLSLKYFRGPLPVNLKSFTYRGFVVARICRLWVPYAGVVLLSALCHQYRAVHFPTVPPAQPWATGAWGFPLTHGMVVRDLNLLQIGKPYLVWQGWTLSVEMILSLLIPAAILIAGRSSLWLVALTVLLVNSANLPIFSCHFAAGVLLAKHFQSVRGFCAHNPVVRYGLLVLGWPLYNIRFVLHTPDLASVPVWLFSGSGALLLLAFAISSPEAQKLLSTAVFCFLGRISYGVYLLHVIVILCVTPHILHWLPPSMPVLNWCIGGLATAGITILIACPFYRFIEKPAILLGKTISRKINPAVR